MATQSTSSPAPHAPLNRERVLRAAVALADEQGIGALTMRRLGQALGVEAMAVYKHVTNKDEIIDGMIELVVAEIELPIDAFNWKDAMRRRANSARTAYARHPWAISVMDSRLNPGPAALAYYDWVIGQLRAGGFSLPMAAHAFAVLDSFIYGFAIQEQSLPFDTSDEAAEVAATMFQHFPAGAYPNLIALATGHVMRPGYRFADEFGFGLELILDGLERASEAEVT
jgi:AcrR family transcriptional regulator